MDTTPTERIERLRTPTKDAPLRIFLSGCLTGRPCGWEGTDYGGWPPFATLAALPNVRIASFCPEDFAFGTPRALADIADGTGDDVLDGRARVLSHEGQDMTAGMIAGAHRMLEEARAHDAELAILMDMSAACGSVAISLGPRLVEQRRFSNGRGVAAALLVRSGIPVIAQRDHRALEHLRHKLDPSYVIDATRVDHHETAWFKAYFQRT